MERGWGFRGLACLELADQANGWLYFRPQPCSLVHKYKVQSFLGTSVSLSVRDEGLALLTSQSFGRRMYLGGSEAAGLTIPCCQLALWQKH